MATQSGVPRFGCISWLNFLTVVLVVLKLGGAINLSWPAVTMPTWGPCVLIFLLLWLADVLGIGKTRTRRTTRTRTVRRRRRRRSKLFG